MRRDPWSLVNVLVLSAVAAIILTVWIVVDQHGGQYYSTPIGVRGYSTPHAVLKPSGSIGHPLGLVGVAMLTVPVMYTVRKHWGRLARAGSMRAWLEVHIFCGIVGPVFVAYHTSLKFNGIISVAYWSMVTVMLSGFVGRYLYVRIPKSIRGVELTHAEIQRRTDELARHLAASGLPPELLARLEPLATGQRVPGRRVRKALVAAGIDRRIAGAAVDTAAERASLLRRLEYLNRTKRLFSMWHVFHQPLVYLMFAIVAVHVGVAIYFGYSWW